MSVATGGIKVSTSIKRALKYHLLKNNITEYKWKIREIKITDGGKILVSVLFIIKHEIISCSSFTCLTGPLFLLSSVIYSCWSQNFQKHCTRHCSHTWNIPPSVWVYNSVSSVDKWTFAATHCVTYNLTDYYTHSCLVCNHWQSSSTLQHWSSMGDCRSPVWHNHCGCTHHVQVV